jgi:hypothetical protein
MAQNVETTGYMIKEINERKEERSQVRIVPGRKRSKPRKWAKREKGELCSGAARLSRVSI